MGEAAAGGRGGGHHGFRHDDGLAAARPRDAEGAAAGGFFGVAALLGAGLVALFRVFRFLVRLRDLGPRPPAEEFRGLDAAEEPGDGGPGVEGPRLQAPPLAVAGALLVGAEDVGAEGWGQLGTGVSSGRVVLSSSVRGRPAAGSAGRDAPRQERVFGAEPEAGPESARPGFCGSSASSGAFGLLRRSPFRGRGSGRRWSPVRGAGPLRAEGSDTVPSPDSAAAPTSSPGVPSPPMMRRTAAGESAPPVARCRSISLRSVETSLIRAPDDSCCCWARSPTRLR
ncbi:hypothetical protein Smic_45320 [Streptomyces microflavus]|uniref:Uncharacterized protein n=1 Tax=Streptomyces microflavus TaxID=1919 RepID=A0A7J0CTY8_STRMI|nr:hypothetical protein Smic_45320 [Streptomyces microflavus]